MSISTVPSRTGGSLEFLLPTKTVWCVFLTLELYTNKKPSYVSSRSEQAALIPSSQALHPVWSEEKTDMVHARRYASEDGSTSFRPELELIRFPALLVFHVNTQRYQSRGSALQLLLQQNKSTQYRA